MKYTDKKIILCALLCTTAPLLTEARAGDSASSVAGLLQPIFTGLGKRIADGDKDSNSSGSFGVGNLLNLGAGAQQSGSVPGLPQGIQGLTAAVPNAAGVIGGMAQVPGLNAVGQVVPGQGGPMAGPAGITGGLGQGIVNNVTYNISNNNSINVSLPEGYKQAIGVDGKPIPIETKIGTDGVPIKVIQALNQQGEPVKLEQKMDATGQQSVVEYKTDTKTGQVQTTVLPIPIQQASQMGGALGAVGEPLSGVKGVTTPASGAMSEGGPLNSIFSGKTKEQLMAVLANPDETPETLAIYQQIEMLAQNDPEDREALKDAKDFMPAPKAAKIRVALLEKYVNQILNNSQRQVAQQTAAVQEMAQQQAIREHQQAVAQRKETVAQQVSRLKEENKQLVNALRRRGVSEDEISAIFTSAINEIAKQGFQTPSGITGGPESSSSVALGLPAVANVLATPTTPDVAASQVLPQGASPFGVTVAPSTPDGAASQALPQGASPVGVTAAPSTPDVAASQALPQGASPVGVTAAPSTLTNLRKLPLKPPAMPSFSALPSMPTFK